MYAWAIVPDQRGSKCHVCPVLCIGTPTRGRNKDINAPKSILRSYSGSILRINFTDAEFTMDLPKHVPKLDFIVQWNVIIYVGSGSEEFSGDAERVFQPGVSKGS